MLPSDYRYNPFGDYSTGVNMVERHVVPSKSPYVVSLSEVPQKDAPPTLKVKAILKFDNEGRPSYGAPFDEVAATPGAGQFYPDYNSGADGCTGWNTGRLLFNKQDAGKIIEVTYKGTGTLAGVSVNRLPAWWTDRGDGSDGAFIPTEDCTISGLKQYTFVYIPAGVVVTVRRYGDIKVQGACVVHGTLKARWILDPAKQPQENGSDFEPLGYAYPCCAGGGETWIGPRKVLGKWFAEEVQEGEPPALIDWSFSPEKVTPAQLASAKRAARGGYSSKRASAKGERPGGTLYLTANSVSVRGTINSNGDDGEGKENWSCGGTGGGILCIIAQTISGREKCTAAGGRPGVASGNDVKSGTAGGDGYLLVMELGQGV